MEGVADAPPSGAHRGDAGMTLIEIAMVVAIIGVLSAISVPGFARARQSSRVTAFVNDMRVASQAFQMYCLENGSYPESSVGGIVPTGMSDYLGKMDWADETPLSGKWVWHRDTPELQAGIVLRRSEMRSGDALAIDEKIDDGDLLTGSFRVVNTNFYAYIVEKRSS